MMAATRSFIVLLATVLVSKGNPSKTSQLVSVQRDDADGTRLIKLGKTFNNSMLKLVGHAFENLEQTVVHELCHKTPCTLWSKWTNCTAKGLATFGYQTRVRKCWYNSTDPCAQDGTVTIETASKMCEGQCRSDYTITKHGFCLKYHPILLNLSQAELLCQSEGGHVMNVDTKERLIDFTPFSGVAFVYVYVDGIRANNKSRFSYRSGADPISNGVLRWQKGQPAGQGSNSLCLVTRLVIRTVYWFEFSCATPKPFVCEIR